MRGSPRLRQDLHLLKKNVKNSRTFSNRLPPRALTGRFDCLGTYPLPVFIGEVGVPVGEVGAAAVLGEVVLIGAEAANAGTGAARFATVGLTAGEATGVVEVEEAGVGAGAGVAVTAGAVGVAGGLEIDEEDKFSTFFSSSSLTSSKVSSLGTSGLGSCGGGAPPGWLSCMDFR